MTSRLSSVKIISAIIEVKYKDLVCSVLYVTVNNACLQAPVQVGISEMLYWVQRHFVMINSTFQVGQMNVVARIVWIVFHSVVLLIQMLLQKVILQQMKLSLAKHLMVNVNLVVLTKCPTPSRISAKSYFHQYIFLSVSTIHWLSFRTWSKVKMTQLNITSLPALKLNSDLMSLPLRSSV